jgi:hypothetical protein
LSGYAVKAWSADASRGADEAGETPRGEAHAPAAALYGLLGLAASVFVPVLKGYWLADDFTWVAQFSRYPWSDVGRLFAGDWSRALSQEYRPLWALSFMVDLSLAGLRPAALHLTNLAYHLIVCALVWKLAASATGAPRLAAPLAVAFFALSPLHAEPVSWISARGHILAPIFILSSMIAMLRFEREGGRLHYAGALACALAALATQEIAVTLPPLLLLRSLLDAPPRGRREIRRTAARHAPFWLLLTAYLLFRYLRFGMLARPDTFESIARLPSTLARGLRQLWLSPMAAVGLPGRWIPLGLALFIALLLFASLVVPPARGRGATARGLLYFAVFWPLLSTAVLFGAESPRHLYLASVGMAVALGLAASRILSSGARAAGAGALALGILLGCSAVGLASNVLAHARSGRLSRLLAREIDRALGGAAGSGPAAITVVIADYPERRAVFWDYFYPEALEPPFRSARLPVGILPSFATCHCPPEQWKTEHAATLARLRDGPLDEVRVVIWDAWRSAFVTRSSSRAAFWQAGYAAPDGPLVRPIWPEGPAPKLP